MKTSIAIIAFILIHVAMPYISNAQENRNPIWQSKDYTIFKDGVT